MIALFGMIPLLWGITLLVAIRMVGTVEARTNVAPAEETAAEDLRPAA